MRQVQARALALRIGLVVAGLMVGGCNLEPDRVATLREDGGDDLGEESGGPDLPEPDPDDGQCNDGVCWCDPPGCQQGCPPGYGPCSFVCPPELECSFDCEAGGCDMFCAQGSQCELDCDAGGCLTRCDEAQDCFTSCEGGQCFAVAEYGAFSLMGCPGGGCTMDCLSGSFCAIVACTSDCTINCFPGADCSVDCSAENGCGVFPISP